MKPAKLARLAVLISLSGASGVAAQAGTAASSAVDTASLLEDLRVLSADSMEGRRAGSAGAERARRYIEARFAEIGLDAVGTAYRHSFELPANRGAEAGEGINLIGLRRGRGSGRPIVVTAHYDHVGVRNGQIYNGADDNASGVAALLAVGRSLVERQPAHTVLLVAFDAEERGLRGARAFVASPPVTLDTIAVNINFDMVSRSAKGELWVAGTHHYPFLTPLVEEIAARSAISLKPGHDGSGSGQDWTGSSDHAPFHAAGVPFLYFGVEDHPDYHRPTDDFERVEPDFFVAAVETLIDAVYTLDQNLDRIIPRRTPRTQH